MPRPLAEEKVASLLVEPQRGLGNGCGDPFRFTSWHCRIPGPAGNPGRHSDLTEPVRDIERPQGSQRHDQRVGVVTEEVTVHPIDHVLRNPGCGPTISRQAPQQHGVPTWPGGCQPHADADRRPTELPAGQPDKPTHHAGDAAATGKPGKAGYRRHPLGVTNGEIERDKPARRPAGGDHAAAPDQLRESRLVKPCKKVFVEVGRHAPGGEHTGKMTGQAQRDPGFGGGIDEELGRQVERGQDAMPEDDRRPAVAGGQVDVGRHEMAIERKEYTRNGERGLQSGGRLPFNARMISKSFWHGKSVLVTGGSSGIGRALGLAAAEAGARVGLLARRGEALAEVVAEIHAAGGEAAAAVCDVTDSAAVARAVAELEERLGPTDIAIASAGLHRVTWPFDAERSRAVIDTNVNGTANLFAAVLPGMLDRGRGYLCGVASLAAVVGLRKNAAYSASKAAVQMLLESLRGDCRPAGITVTAAFPGYVDTPMITAEERAAGIGIPVREAAERILEAIERGRAEVWFPRWTALQARLLRLLPQALRDAIVSGLPPMEEA